MESRPVTQPEHSVNLNLLSVGFEYKHLKAKNTFYLIFENRCWRPNRCITFEKTKCKQVRNLTHVLMLSKCLIALIATNILKI